jgi:hypothetical protein
VDVERELVGIIEIADCPRAAICDAMRAILFVAMHFNPNDKSESIKIDWLAGARDCLRYARDVMDEYKRAASSEGE